MQSQWPRTAAQPPLLLRSSWPGLATSCIHACMHAFTQAYHARREYFLGAIVTTKSEDNGPFQVMRPPVGLYRPQAPCHCTAD